MKTYIFGKRSYLSKHLSKIIKNCEIVASQEFHNKNLFIKKFNEKKFNLIINTFYPSSKINSIDDYNLFYEKSILNITKILDNINANKINKIIYSSSSSIYGSLDRNFLYQDKFNRKLYASTKITCERLIQNFATKKKVNFVIARIFNMYGEGDNFSIISKIINSKKNRLIINNNGQSLRDFIYVKDIAKSFKILIKSKFCGEIDIGNGYGIKIKDIIDNISIIKKKVTFKKGHIHEEHSAFANVDKLSKIIKINKFYTLEKFLHKQLRLKRKINLPKFHSKNQNTYEKIVSGTIIYGAGYAGKNLYESLKRNNQSVYCFVDDNKNKINKYIDGKKIISFDRLNNLKETFIIPNIIVAIAKINYQEKLNLIKKLLPICLNLNFLPNRDELIKDNITISDVRNIELSDLFNRKISKINFSLLSKLKKKNILITGGAGSIGSELCIQVAKLNPTKIVLFDHDETALFDIQRKMKLITNTNVVSILGNINDTNFLRKIIKDYKISNIYHAAAYKHVSILENNPLKAIQNNIFGTISILKSISNDVNNITIISTDKAANPKNVLGFTKRIAEIVSQNYFLNSNLSKKKLSIVRFGNVFGSQGSAVQIFTEQLSKGQPVTISDYRAERYFMSIKEACNLVLQGSQIKTKKNSIIVLKMGKPIKILNVIKKIIELFNINEKNVPIIKTGLKSGEKLKEKISISDLFYKTKHPDILQIKEPIYSIEQVNKLIIDLTDLVKTYKGHEANLLMKSFLKKEIGKLI